MKSQLTLMRLQARQLKDAIRVLRQDQKVQAVLQERIKLKLINENTMTNQLDLNCLSEKQLKDLAWVLKDAPEVQVVYRELASRQPRLGISPDDPDWEAKVRTFLKEGTEAAEPSRSDRIEEQLDRFIQAGNERLTQIENYLEQIAKAQKGLSVLALSSTLRQLDRIDSNLGRLLENSKESLSDENA